MATMRLAVILALLTLLLLLFGAMPALADQQQSWTARYPLRPGGRVAVANVQGSIWVEGWDQPEVELTAVKSAEDPDADLNDAAVEVEPGPDSLTFRTLYSAETEEPVRVDYRLRVPRQTRLDGLHTVNGDIGVRGVEGGVEARTLNGNIWQAGVAGTVRARTLNGSVQVSLRARPEPETALELETVNGDVALLLPADSDADLELNTVAGEIESRLAYTASAAGPDGSWRARLGRGGARVRLRSIRGDIHVGTNEGIF